MSCLRLTNYGHLLGTPLVHSGKQMLSLLLAGPQTLPLGQSALLAQLQNPAVGAFGSGATHELPAGQVLAAVGSHDVLQITSMAWQEVPPPPSGKQPQTAVGSVAFEQHVAAAPVPHSASPGLLHSGGGGDRIGAGGLW